MFQFMISSYVGCHHFFLTFINVTDILTHSNWFIIRRFVTFWIMLKKKISYQCNKYFFILYMSCILQKVWIDYFYLEWIKYVKYKKLYLDKVNILLIFLYTLPHDKSVSSTSSSLDYKLIINFKNAKILFAIKLNKMIIFMQSCSFY